MRWTSSLRTGNSVVDEEHKALIGLIDELEFVGAGPDGSKVGDALDQLTDYVFVHFQMEEKLMRREEYPVDRFEDHRAQHHGLASKTRDLVAKYEDGTLTSVDPIVEFLYDWFQNHIATTDTAMAQYIRARHEG